MITIFAVLMRIRSQLLKLQRHEQSGSTRVMTTANRIPALGVLVERRRGFRQRMLAANGDLEKSIDTVYRKALGSERRGITTRIVLLLTGLHFET